MGRPSDHLLQDDGSEPLDGELVLVPTAPLPAVPADRPALPAVQAAAVAAGSFLAGAAVAGVVTRRRRARTLAAASRRSPRRRRGSAAGDMLQIVASRSLLVDVHLLGLPGSER